MSVAPLQLLKSEFNPLVYVALDNAAAIAGGLTTGMLYKTTAGGITALNIVP